jgi:chemotaxis protein CheC
MFLTDAQRDAITELLNIGFSRSALALSQLTGYRILLSIPEVKVLPVEELGAMLSGIVPDNLEKIATVHQIFNGPVSGDAMLILSEEDSRTLTNLLLNSSNDDLTDATMKDVLAEVGNILINSCMGIFGNILKIQITFTVPQLQLESFDKLIRSLTIDYKEISYALMVAMKFHIRDQSVSGYMILVLGVTSLDQFLAEIEKLN